MTPSTTPEPVAAQDVPLAERVAAIDWYHTFDLPGAITTPGLFDLRKVAPKLPIPASLAGKRVLDVAASDGFWSFELARRDAAETVSLDLDDHTQQDWQGADNDRGSSSGRARQAFDVAADGLGLTDVKRVDMSVYDITPDALGGHFDYVFIGSVLLHLADPVRALRAVRGVLEPDGELLSFDVVSLPLTLMRPLRPAGWLATESDARWWTPNVAAHRRWVSAAGFEITATGGPVFQPFGPGFYRVPRRVPWRASHLGFWLVQRWTGQSSMWIRATPSPGEG